MKNLSCKIDDDLEGLIEAEVKRTPGVTVSDVVRKALREFFSSDQRVQNMKALSARFDQVVFEIVKTQFLVARCSDPDRTILTKQVYEQAGLDAEDKLKNGQG